jgi:L-ascorbate 6-phosphate lactonase
MDNAVELSWLGQAGFVARGSATTVAFDPYLSELCRSTFGLERRTPAPVAPAEIGADVVLVSHWHEDHLDLDSAHEFVSAGGVYIAPPSCIFRLSGKGIDASALVPIVAGQSIEFADVSVTAVPAVHQVPGALTEDAVGYLLEIDGVRIYHSGDTQYDRTMLAAGDRGAVDVALVCSNGSGGNMNVWEAALLAAQLRPELVVPMHFGMWSDEGYGAGATLDPSVFLEIYGRLAAGARAQLPSMADPLLLAAT